MYARILLLYEADNRVRRYAETLTQRGDVVEVISLRRQGQGDYNVLNGVRVHRVQERVRNEKRKWDYLRRILGFFIRSATLITKMHLARPFDLVHVHSVPDFEVFAALLPKLNGAKVILDIHDIVPELYCNKFKEKQYSILFKALVLVERLSTKFADHTIISNDLWKERLISRSVLPENARQFLTIPMTSSSTTGTLRKITKRLYCSIPVHLIITRGLRLRSGPLQR